MAPWSGSQPMVNLIEFVHVHSVPASLHLTFVKLMSFKAVAEFSDIWFLASKQQVKGMKILWGASSTLAPIVLTTLNHMADFTQQNPMQEA